MFERWIGRVCLLWIIFRLLTGLFRIRLWFCSLTFHRIDHYIAWRRTHRLSFSDFYVLFVLLQAWRMSSYFSYIWVSILCILCFCVLFFSRKFSSTIQKMNASRRNKVVLFFSSFSFFFFLVNFLRLFKETERVKSTSSFIFIATYQWLIIVPSISVQCKSSFSRSSKFGFSHAENLRRLISENF
jgi:hypothetical protein